MAARAVVAENYLLRELLKSHLNRSDRDIDMLLVHMRGDHTTSHTKAPKKSSSHHHSETSPPDIPITSSHHSKSANARASSSTAAPAAKRQLLPIARAPQLCDSLTAEPPVLYTHVRDSTPQHNVISRIVEDTFPDDAVCDSRDIDHRSPYGPPSTVTEPTVPQGLPETCKHPENSISCEEAASIIANLRLQHMEDVRGELGCTNAVSCSIENMALLQIMTEAF